MAFATCLYHGGVFWHFIGIYSLSFGTPWWCHCVLRFATAPAVLFHHFNSRTVFAVISHTSVFRCMYRHNQALTYVMVIGLWLDRLAATWPHLFTGLPAIIYCTSMGKHLWAASLDTAHSLWSPKYNASVQRNMKFGHRSTTEVCNVTWSVFTDVQQKCAT